MVGLGYGNSQTFLNSVEIIDLNSNPKTCQNLPNYPISDDGVVGALTLNERPFICGGFYGSCYTYAAGTWTKSNPMTTGRYFAALAPSPFQNQLNQFAVTGVVTNDPALENTGELFSNGSWQGMSPNLPVQIHHHCMVLVNATTLMIISGSQNGEDEFGVDPSANTFYFNTDNGIWKPGPNLNNGRSYFGCARIRQDSKSLQYSIIVAGGFDGTSYLSSVELLDAGATTWRTGPELPTQIGGHTMVEYNSGSVVLVAGGNSDLTYLDTIYQLVDGSSHWVLMKQKLKVGRCCMTSYLVPDAITPCN